MEEIVKIEEGLGELFSSTEDTAQLFSESSGFEFSEAAIKSMAHESQNLIEGFSMNIGFDNDLLQSDNILKTIQKYDGRYNKFLSEVLIPKPSTEEDASLPTVTTQEEFDALPSGTIFLNADGSKAKKP